MEHPKHILRAKELRRSMPTAERILWSRLQNNQIGHTFRRQQPIGSYFVDFICIKKRLIIELDGDQHADIDAIEYDNRRTDYIKSQGFALIRIPNDYIRRDLDSVLYSLRLVLDGVVKPEEIFVEKYDMNPNKNWIPPENYS